MTVFYDSSDTYDNALYPYDGGGAPTPFPSGYAAWLGVLNQLAGTVGLGENEAANFYAYGGDKGNGLLKALNDKAHTTDLDINEVCNKIAGTNGLSALAALNIKAGNLPW